MRLRAVTTLLRRSVSVKFKPMGMHRSFRLQLVQLILMGLRALIW